MKLSTTLPALALLGVLLATPAAGQTSPSRPYRGLFGGGVAEDAEQMMTVNGSLGAGYDDNLRADAAGGGLGSGNVVDPRDTQNGVLNSFSGSLSYAMNRETVSMSAAVASTGRYYPDLDPGTVIGRRGSVEAQWRLSTRTTLTGGLGLYYRPFSLAGFFPSADGFPLTDSPLVAVAPPVSVETVDVDQAMGPDLYFGYGTHVGLSRRMSRRATASVNYLFRTVDGRAGFDQSHRHAGNGAMLVELGKGLGLNLGYGLRRNYNGSREPIDDHNMRGGLTYNRALSFSRRTTVAFNTGTAATSGQAGRTTYRATGAVAVTHEIGRTWTATGTYNRGVRFVDALTDPLFGDAISASVTGLLTRRLQLMSSTHASLGNTSGSQFDAYYSSVVLQMAVTRFISASTSYSYFVYTFDQDVRLPPGVPREIDRHSVKVQASLWAPIFQRTRRTNASR